MIIDSIYKIVLGFFNPPTSIHYPLRVSSKNSKEDSRVDIKIKADDKVIGIVQTILIPKNCDTWPLVTAYRVMFYKSFMQDYFISSRLERYSQIIPFQIEIIDEAKNLNINIRNAWINNTGFCYNSNDLVIADPISFEAEEIIINSH